MMVGNTLAAVDDTEFVATEEETPANAAAELEREIMLRKLAETQTGIEEKPLALAEPTPEFKKESPLSQSSASAHSVLSQGTFFDHLDQEIIDPFRSPNNFDNFFTRMLDHLDYKIGVFGEYDDNIFLTPSGKVSDHKVIVSQSFSVQYPMDKFYLELGYGVDLEYYTKMDELIDTQNASGRLSYYPFDKLSLGLSNQVQKVGDSAITTSIGDDTLGLGFLTNNTRVEAKYELWKNGFFETFYNLEHIDFDGEDSALFINRNTHTVDFRLRHRFFPQFSNYFGYRLKDVVFDDFPLKDQESSIFFYGGDYEVPGWFTLFSEIGYESKEFKETGGSLTITSTDPTFPFSVTTPFEPRRDGDNNVNFLCGIESNLSRYNNISLTYNSKLNESSRPEFTQYLGKTFAVNSRTFLDNKTILFNSLFLEYQDFDDDDAFDLLFPAGGAKTKIYSSGVTLRRILNDWLSMDVGYTYTKRDTDFGGESSKNNRFRFGANATF